MTLSYDWKAPASGRIKVWIEFYDAAFNPIPGEFAGAIHTNKDFGPDDRTEREVQAPANAFYARLVFQSLELPSGTETGFRRAKFERGRLPATSWTDDNTVAGLSAQLDITAAVAADAQEGIDAFLTKREPQWQHRR